MTARWARVESALRMGAHGAQRGNVNAPTSTFAPGSAPRILLCKQGVDGSSPFSSTVLTSRFVLPAGLLAAAERRLRVECALGRLA